MRKIIFLAILSITLLLILSANVYADIGGWSGQYFNEHTDQEKTAPTDGQIYKWNDEQKLWVLGTDATGSSDVTDVWNCAGGDCKTLTIGESEYLIGGTVDGTTDPYISLPQGADVSSVIGEGRISWDTDNDKLYIGTGAAAKEIISTEVDPTVDSSAEIMAIIGADGVKDTHIDWGTGASQVSADDVPDGATNAIITLTQETNFETAYSHSQDNTQAHSDYLLNSGSDMMTGTLTADGFTLGTNEYLTFGTKKLYYDAITSNDFELEDDLNINDTTPHLKLVDTTANEDDFEITSDGSQFWIANLDDVKKPFLINAFNQIQFYEQIGFIFPDSAPSDNQILKYDSALGRMNFEADAGEGSNIAQLHFDIDGGGSAITTGAKSWVRVPFDMTLTGWDISADVSGSIVIDVWNDTYANFPPTVADTMIATGTKPVLSSAQKNQDATIDWADVTISAGEYIRINVDSVATITKVTLDLYGEKS